MSNEPTWSKTITPEKLVNLVVKVLQDKYKRVVTRDARRTFRKAIERELDQFESEEEYETSTSTPIEGAERIADLVMGDKALGQGDHAPTLHSNSVEGYDKVGRVAAERTIAKVKAYHRASKFCPVWPFCK